MKEDLENLVRECKAFCDKYDKEYVTVCCLNDDEHQSGWASCREGEGYEEAHLSFDDIEVI